MLILTVAVAWLTAFIPLPRWLSAIVTIAVLGIGTVLVFSGAMNYWWDRSMQPGQTGGLHALVAGIALLLSRAKIVLRIIAGILAEV